MDVLQWSVRRDGQREERGRLLLCWTRRTASRPEEHGNWNRWNPRTVNLGTGRLVIRTLVRRTAILGRERPVRIIDLSHPKPTEKDDSDNTRPIDPYRDPKPPTVGFGSIFSEPG
eukprot:scaffold770_cov362-Pavlova_lutheri.AAC.6